MAKVLIKNLKPDDIILIDGSVYRVERISISTPGKEGFLPKARGSEG